MRDTLNSLSKCPKQSVIYKGKGCVMNKKLLISMLVVVVMIVAVIGIKSLQEPKNLQESYKLGAILPLTGRVAMLGENVRNGMQMAMEEINAAGGINGKMLEIQFGDSRNDPKEGVSLMNKFTSVSNLPVVVTAMTSITSPLIPIAERNNTVIFATMVSSPTFANKSEYLFRCFTRAETEVPPLAKIAYEEIGMRRIISLYVDDDFGKGYTVSYKTEFEKLGGKIVGEIPFARGGSDFRNTIAKLKSIEADGIYLVGYDKAMGLIPKQIREMGIKTPLLANASMASPAYLKIAGEASEGIVLMNFAFSTRSPKTEEGKKLVDKYKEKFGSTPLVLTVIGYDIVGLLAKAIQTNGYGSDNIRLGLLSIQDFDGVIGKLMVQPDGEVDVPLMPLVIRGGRPTPFKPSSTK